MSWKANEPGGVPADPAQCVAADLPSYPVPKDPQGLSKARDAERRLIAAGWTWPSQLACDCERFGVLDLDFGDRLCGTLCGFLRACGEDGRNPDIPTAEAVLTRFAVPRDPGELAVILWDTTFPTGDDFADLVADVLRGAEQRTAQQLRELICDALRALKHSFECPRCIACANGISLTGARHGAVWEVPSAGGRAVRHG
jgi:hypothetical protein